ncbi:MAG: ATP-dependent DNA ligase, partial [Myxococcota bacterium]
MKRLALLFEALDQTTSTNAKVEHMVEYFSREAPENAAWTVFFLTGQRMKRLIGSRQLHAWVSEASELPDWLVRESYSVVGDIAETVALLLENEDGESTDIPLHVWMTDRIEPLRHRDESFQREQIVSWWKELPTREIFLLNKLLTGGFRVGVSKTLVVRALAKVAGVPPPTVQHRLMGGWTPSAPGFLRLLSEDTSDVEASRPYPFFLASPLEREVNSLGDPTEWAVEWKWDGIRSQLVVREGQVFLWSRGEELVTERYPEVTEDHGLKDGVVLDGELLAYRDGPLPFAELQRRIGRKTVSDTMLDEVPAAFMAYDILEHEGRDLREEPLTARRALLESVVASAGPALIVSPLITKGSWVELVEERSSSREKRVEGLMLKRWESPYRSGRKRGDWWKWKIEPFSIDAVMIYAQAGHGKRANLYTDYTFAVWDGDALTPVAKAYSGLDNDEIQRLDKWIRKNTLEKFGPVRSVTPEHVFELAFEGIQSSTRHKSGVALRFPRIARWREDKKTKDADTLEQVKRLLHVEGEAVKNAQGRE